MKENKDYKLIPVDIGNEQAWEVRILTGDFVESVIRFGNIMIDGPNDAINFNFTVAQSPSSDIDENDEELQIVVGNILSDLIENSIQDGSILLDDQ